MRPALVHLRDAIERLEAAGEREKLLESWREVAELTRACRASKELDRACERIMALLEADANADPAELLGARIDRAEARGGVGDHTGAAALLAEVVVAAEGRSDLPRELALRAHHARGRSLHALGDPVAASRDLEPVLAARARSLGASEPLLVRTKLDTALVRKALGDLEGARLLLQDVLAASESTLGRLERARARLELAATNTELGLQPCAPEVLATIREEARDFERLPGGKAFMLRLAALEAGLLAAEQLARPTADGPGVLLEARRRSVIASFSRLRPPAPSSTGYSSFLTTAVTGLAPPAPCAPPPPEALPGFAQPLASVGVVAGSLEQLPSVAAASPYVAALAVPVALEDPETAGKLAALAGAVIALREAGNLVAALDKQREHVDVLEHSLVANDPRLFDARLELARSGLLAEASPAAFGGLDELLEQGSASRAPGDPEVIEARWQLALAKRELGDSEGARALLHQVLAEREATLPAAHSDIHAALVELAWTEVELQANHEASKLLVRLLDLLRERVRDCSSLGPREGREVARVELGRLAEALSLADALGSSEVFERDVFGLLESLRLLSTPLPAHLLGTSSELSGLRREAAQVRAELSDLCLLGPGSEPQAAWAGRVRELEARLDQLGAVIRAAQPELRALLERTEASELALHLSEHAAVLTFWRHLRTFARQGEEVPEPQVRIAAFLVRADGDFERADLGLAGELEAMTEAYLSALGSASELRGGGAVSAATGPGASGAALLERLITPLAAGVVPVSELHVCLDGALHLLPLESMPLEDGALLGQRFALQREVSLARILAPSRPLTRNPSRAPELLLVGGVDYDAPPGDEYGIDAGSTVQTTAPLGVERGRGSRLAPLVATAREVDGIAEIFEQTTAGEVRTLSGTAATKPALRRAVRGARYVHLATHGWAAPEELPALGAEWRPGASSVVRGFAPLVLCGVALTGANHGRDEVGRVPGILTAEELAGFDLASAELAVLSACETGVGLQRAGQGVHSLQTALHAAGARSVITSLWRVEDEATAAFMQAFYHALWRDGSSKRAALDEARRELRERGASMRDWAGWVLSGDPE